MSENKCPCCGEDLKFGDKISGFYPTVDCKKCGFPRNPHMRERIAAAMELAKAEVAASNAVWSVPLERLEPTVEAAEAVLFQAKKRVLEVWNG